MIVVLLSLIPLIMWGVGDYLAARGSRRINVYSLSFFMMIVGFSVTVPVSLAISAPVISLTNVLQFMVASICINAGFLSMVKGFNYGPVGIVAPIANSYAIVTVLFAVLFQNSSMSFVTLLGVLVVTLGVVTVSYSKPAKGEFKNARITIAFSLFSLVIFGLGFIVLGYASDQSWNQNLAIFQTTGLIVATLVFLFAQRKNKLNDIRTAYKTPYIYLAGACGGIGLIGMTAAIQISKNGVAVPSAIAAAAPLVTALLAYVFDKEHLTKLQRAATVIIVAGIILLSLK